jgi:hypothetical protein
VYIVDIELDELGGLIGICENILEHRSSEIKQEARCHPKMGIAQQVNYNGIIEYTDIENDEQHNRPDTLCTPLNGIVVQEGFQVPGKKVRY